MCKGLYIHIPFCIKKCKYCDFISFCDKDEYFDLYIDSLKKEAHHYKGEKIDTVFVGGGTPTVLKTHQLERLFGVIYDTFEILPDAEITIEANPKTLSKEKLLFLKKAGVNRISIGVQSFCDKELSLIGRVHNANEAYDTVREVIKSGFDNFNLDLMLNLPQQRKESLLDTLKTAVSLNPAHISCYSLILEEGTPLFDEYKSGEFTEPDDDYDRELYHIAVDFLKEHGYFRYEISNFSKKGRECRHNIKYWSCKDYIGLGVSAHSYVDGVRYRNTKDLKKYLSGEFHADDRVALSRDDKMAEYMIMKLRMDNGVSEEEFYSLFGKKITDIYKTSIDKFISGGFMEYKNGCYSLTDKGIDVSNSVLCEFV